MVYKKVIRHIQAIYDLCFPSISNRRQFYDILTYHNGVHKPCRQKCGQLQMPKSTNDCDHISNPQCIKYN